MRVFLTHALILMFNLLLFILAGFMLSRGIEGSFMGADLMSGAHLGLGTGLMAASIRMYFKGLNSND